MLLNSYFFSDHLSIRPVEARLTSDRLVCRLTHGELYCPSLQPEEDTLYVLDAAQLALVPETSAAVFACIGTPLDERSADDVLVFPPGTDLLLLLHEIQRLFLLYQQWDQKMYRLLAKGASLKELAEACLPVVHNPICVSSTDLRTLTYAERDGKAPEDRLFSDSDIGSYHSDEDISAMRRDPSFVAGFETHTPGFLSLSYFGYRHFYNNIFISGTYVARVIFCEVESQIRDSDYALIVYICGFFKIAFRNYNFSFNRHPQYFDELIQKLALGQSITPKQLSPVLEKYGWSLRGRYFCCLIDSTQDILMHSQHTLCGQLERSIASSAAIVIQSQILLIVNLQVSGQEKDVVRTCLSPLIHETLLKIGISNLFDEFPDLPLYFEQAGDALRIGAAVDPDLWCYNYDSYALPVMLDRFLGGRKRAALCPESLQPLLEYDRRHNRDYTTVLKTYLKNNMSIAKTMRELYVQRPGLLYQINRIREITGLDLDDYATRLHLMIYFAFSKQ